MGKRSVEAGIDKLEKRLGREKVVSDPAIVRLYAREPSGLRGDAWAVVFPESEEDVRVLARMAYEYEIPVYPQGSTTSLSGNTVPQGGIVVSFERMNRILEVNIVDSNAIVEPGVRIDDLNEELEKHGYMFPVDPASSAVATVGGAINNGAGGLRGAKYGTMRDWVLGLNLVLVDEDASLIRVGCRTVKCRQGLDLTRLVVGSEGTLGLVTQAILRITPLPEDTVYALAFFDSLDDLVEAFVEIRRSGLNPFMLEFMDSRTVDYAARNLELPYTPRGDMLLVGVEVNREAAERVLSSLVSLLRKHGAREIVTAHGTEEARSKELFTVRKNLFTGQAGLTMEKVGPGKRIMVLIEDIVVPPSRVPEAVRRIRILEKKYGFTTFLGGHIGDGNLHPAVGFAADDSDARRRVEEWFREVMRIAVELGGSVSAEHGIGVLKREGLRYELEARNSLKALDIMREIKRAFDPKGLLNPGKIF